MKAPLTTSVGDKLRESGHVSLSDTLRRAGFAIPPGTQKQPRSGHKNSEEKMSTPPDQGKDETMSNETVAVNPETVNPEPATEVAATPAPTPPAATPHETEAAPVPPAPPAVYETLAQMPAMAQAAEAAANAAADSAKSANTAAARAAGNAVSAEQAALQVDGMLEGRSLGDLRATANVAFTGSADNSVRIAALEETIVTAKRLGKWSMVGALSAAAIGGLALFGVKVAAPRIRKWRAPKPAPVPTVTETPASVTTS